VVESWCVEGLFFGDENLPLFATLFALLSVASADSKETGAPGRLVHIPRDLGTQVRTRVRRRMEPLLIKIGVSLRKQNGE
jgi:hypothetical protein